MPSVTDSADTFTAIGSPARHARRRRSIAEQRDDLVEHHPVDVPDQPVALGGRQEAPGRDQAPVRFVGETQQRLVVGDPSDR